MNTYPERTDMSPEEVIALVDKADTLRVIEETETELAYELSENPGMGYGEIVDKINERF